MGKKGSKGSQAQVINVIMDNEKKAIASIDN
jgi:hypothetical protein